METETKYGIIGAIAFPLFIFSLGWISADLEIALNSLIDMWYAYICFVIGGFVIGYKMLSVTNSQTTHLEKHKVCDRCLSVDISDPDCMCCIGKYDTIELEFEVCNCCGNIVNDGRPAETEFNTKQLNK